MPTIVLFCTMYVCRIYVKNFNPSRQDVPEENLGDWNILEDDDNDALEGLLLPLVNVNVLPDP